MGVLIFVLNRRHFNFRRVALWIIKYKAFYIPSSCIMLHNIRHKLAVKSVTLMLAQLSRLLGTHRKIT